MVRKCQCGALFPSPEHQIISNENESLCAQVPHVVEGGREVLCTLQFLGKDLDRASLCCLPDRVKDDGVLSKRAAPNHSDTLSSWKGLEKQLQPLTAERCLTVSNTREIAARMSKARNQSKPNRIGDESKYYRRYHSSAFQGEGGWRGYGDDYVLFLGSQASHQCFQPLGISL